MDSVFKVLIASIKSKFTKIWTKFRQWTNLNYVRSKVVIRIRDFFLSLFNVKPRDKYDYYTVFSWMISKKLAFSIVVVLGVLSTLIVLSMQPIRMPDSLNLGTVSAYKYNSLALRFKKGTVTILAKDKHRAYEGEVEGGACNGNGKLYRKDGSLLYSGQFVNSAFEGTGNWYDENGVLRYQGSFAANQYQGQGVSFWENGARQYSGEFERGLRSGQGTLCSAAGRPVFTGLFSADHLVYSQLAGKTTAELAEMYTGSTVIYSGDNSFCVSMPDIDAIYAAPNETTSLDATRTIDALYVLENSFVLGEQVCNSIADVKALLGKPEYQGLTDAELPEAVAVSELRSRGKTIFADPQLKTESDFSNALTVTSYQMDYELYVYTFRYDDLMYSFYCSKQGGPFALYSIQ